MRRGYQELRQKSGVEGSGLERYAFDHSVIRGMLGLYE